VSAGRLVSARAGRSSALWGIAALLAGMWAAFWSLWAPVVGSLSFVALSFGVIGLLISWAALRRGRILQRRWPRWAGWAGLILSAFSVVIDALVLIDGLTGKARF